MSGKAYQTVWPRMGAYVIDNVIILLPFMVIGWLFGNEPLVNEISVWALIVYRILMHGHDGQTLGKRFRGVRVLQVSGASMSYGRAALREAVPIFLRLTIIVFVLVYLDDYRAYLNGRPVGNSTVTTILNGWMWLFFGWILLDPMVALFNRRRRAIHDFIAGTVVHLESAELALDTVAGEAEVRGQKLAAELPDDADPRLQEAMQALDAGDYGRAAASYRAMIDVDRQDEIAHQALTIAFDAFRERAEAFRRKWLIACGVGWAGGLLLGLLVVLPLAFFFDVFEDDPGIIFFAAPVGTAFSVLGMAQWTAIRQYVPHSTRWIPAGIVSGLAVTLATYAISGILSADVSWEAPVADWLATLLLLLLPIGIVLLTGLPQGLVLRSWGKPSAKWVWTNVWGWTLSLGALGTIAFLSVVVGGFCLPLILACGAVFGLLSRGVLLDTLAGQDAKELLDELAGLLSTEQNPAFDH